MEKVTFHPSPSRHRFSIGRLVKYLRRCVSVLTTVFVFASFMALLRIDSKPSIDISNTVQIHDPYLLRRNPPSFTVTNTTCSTPPGIGEEGPAGIRALYKIYRHSQAAKLSLNDNTRRRPSKEKIRLFCMVYTHSNRHDVIRAIAETYGKACDGFMAASNLTDTFIGTFNLPHDGPEVYQNMWNKVQKMWFYAYSHYLLEFDWFLICGDDTFVIPDNVRTVAAQYEAEAIQNQRKSKGHNAKPTPLYLGASIPHSKNPKRRYCGGGAGYMLNQQAVLLLNRRIHMGECPDAVASDEDIRVARCLDDAGVQCHDTNDEAEEVRFHHLDAQFHASWTPQRSALWLWPKLQYFHGIRGNQSKLEQISNTTTTFHLDRSKVRTRVHDRGIRRYHAILHPELCGSEFAEQVKVAATCNAEQQARLRQAWMVHNSAYK
jgi:glycoprotein-N-acetylgalactosamine 3-beta-galactosyltransferase